MLFELLLFGFILFYQHTSYYVKLIPNVLPPPPQYQNYFFKQYQYLVQNLYDTSYNFNGIYLLIQILKNRCNSRKMNPPCTKNNFFNKNMVKMLNFSTKFVWLKNFLQISYFINIGLVVFSSFTFWGY